MGELETLKKELSEIGRGRPRAPSMLCPFTCEVVAACDRKVAPADPPNFQSGPNASLQQTQRPDDEDDGNMHSAPHAQGNKVRATERLYLMPRKPLGKLIDEIYDAAVEPQLWDRV